MRRRGDTHRMVRWLWTSRRPDARLARLALLPVSGLWRAVMAGRGLAHPRGWVPGHHLPPPPRAGRGPPRGGGGGKPTNTLQPPPPPGRGGPPPRPPRGE